jgi:hypothetical protein
LILDFRHGAKGGFDLRAFAADTEIFKYTARQNGFSIVKIVTTNVEYRQNRPRMDLRL